MLKNFFVLATLLAATSIIEPPCLANIGQTAEETSIASCPCNRKKKSSLPLDNAFACCPGCKKRRVV